MLNHGPQSKADQMRQKAVMLSGSFFFMVGAFAFMVFSSTQAKIEKVPLDVALQNQLTLPLAVAAVMIAALSFLVKKMIAPPVGRSDLMQARMDEAAGKEPDMKRLQKHFASHIAAYAVSEAPAVFGFIVGQATSNFEVAIPFFLLSLLLFAIHFPRGDWK